MTSVWAKGPVVVLEKPPVDELVDSEIERPPAGAGALTSSAIAVDGWPAVSVWADGAIVREAFTVPLAWLQLPRPVQRL